MLAERRAAEPVLPLKLLRNQVFVTTGIVAVLLGFAMFGTITFLPLYFQVVKGASPTGSGLDLLPLMAGLLHHVHRRRSDRVAHRQVPGVPDRRHGHHDRRALLALAAVTRDVDVGRPRSSCS